MKTTSVLRLACLFASLLFLNGCGGSGGGSAPVPQEPQIISGHAAAGAPLVGSVTIKDSSSPVKKEKTVTIAADGSYSVDVSGMTGPFALRADGRVGVRYYQLCSAATLADVGGTLNITPFTDLIVANLAGDLAANYYTNGAFATLNGAELSAAEAELQHKLQPLFTAAGLPVEIDLLHTPFIAGHTGLDGLFDLVRVTVDPATATAAILNLVSNTAITDDLRSRSDTAAFTEQDAANVAAGMSDVQLIVATVDRLSALFANGMPGPTNPVFPTLFDQASFLHDGDGLSAFLAGIAADPAMIDVQFADITILALDPVAGTGEIAFFPVQTRRTQKIEVFRFQLVKRNGSWFMQGNQRIAQTSLRAASRYWPGNAIGNQIQTGLDPAIRDRGKRGIDYAIINGPGLPPDATVLSSKVFTRIPVDYFTLPLEPRSDFLAMDEAAVAALPDTDATYTITLWEDNATTATTADDTLLATYTETIAKRPYQPSELAVASFPALTAAGQAAWDAVIPPRGVTGAHLALSWTLPVGLQPDFLFAQSAGVASFNSQEIGSDHFELPLRATQTETSFTFHPVIHTQTVLINSGTIIHGVQPAFIASRRVDLGAIDGFGRSLRTIYSIADPFVGPL